MWLGNDREIIEPWEISKDWDCEKYLIIFTTIAAQHAEQVLEKYRNKRGLHICF